jgi:hypothetical protein
VSDAPPREAEGAAAAAPRRSRAPQRVATWLVTIACFAYLWLRIDGAAGPDRGPLAYLAEVFASVSWTRWLALMVPYSFFFLLIDTLVLWRVVNWFNARISYAHLLPLRASAYILSIVNEQVGKGAIALYLNRRFGVPGWQLGSSMLFIMFCEFYYLLAWANLGYLLQREGLPAEFGLLPWIGVAALAFFVLWHLYFRGVLLPASALRERHVVHAFRQARVRHYLGVIALRSPALIVAVFVYTSAIRLFGIDASFLHILGLLPVIFFGAAIPTPMRAAAITLWATLFAGQPGEATAFGFVQHNFFIFFNAAIGLLFLRKANRELFGPGEEQAARA